LVASAQRAFTAGFTAAATIMAALLAMTAVVVAVRLRGARPVTDTGTAAGLTTCRE
jgi:hypothetical protein